MTKKLTTTLITCSFLVLGLFWLGHVYELFQNFFWYDKLLHFLGGAWIGVIIVYLFKKHEEKMPFFRFFKENPIKTIVFLMLLVGIGWELFEFLITQYTEKRFGHGINMQPSNIDTIGDIITNIIGAVSALSFTKK